MGHLLMSERERQLKVLFEMVKLGALSQEKVSEQTALRYRQIKRLHKRYQLQRDAGLILKSRLLLVSWLGTGQLSCLLCTGFLDLKNVYSAPKKEKPSYFEALSRHLKPILHKPKDVWNVMMRFTKTGFLKGASIKKNPSPRECQCPLV